MRSYRSVSMLVFSWPHFKFISHSNQTSNHSKKLSHNVTCDKFDFTCKNLGVTCEKFDTIFFNADLKV